MRQKWKQLFYVWYICFIKLIDNSIDIIGFFTYDDYCTVCPGSSDPVYIVTYYIKWVTTSWTHSSI